MATGNIGAVTQTPRVSTSKTGRASVVFRKIWEEIGLPKPLEIGYGLSAIVCEITPEVAAVILEEFHIKNNRNIRKAVASGYARDISTSGWDLTGQPICFNTDDNLCDGQHRLKGCVDSQTPFVTVVVYGVPVQSMRNIDNGINRSVIDAANISDMDARKRDASIIKALWTGYNDKIRLTRNESLWALDVFSDVLQFINSSFPKSTDGLVTSVRAAYGRASYYEDSERLKEFAWCLRETTTNNPNEDSSSRVLLKFLNRMKGRQPHGVNLEIFRKTQSAIRDFCQRKTTSSLRSSAKDIYPLPGTVLEVLRAI